MQEQARRGFAPSDVRQFSAENLPLLRRAQGDLACLLNRGYEVGHCAAFVGDHYQLSSRQRMALMRTTASDRDLEARRERELRELPAGETIRIDGFNLIIPLEIALSGGTLLLCMDGVVRDLAGLHGSYRMIAETDEAICMIGAALKRRSVAAAEFYFDAPVSNAGRLAQRVRELLAEEPFAVVSRTEPHVDTLLARQENAASGDSVILSRCKSWVNLGRAVLRESLPDCPLIDLSCPEG